MEFGTEVLTSPVILTCDADVSSSQDVSTRVTEMSELLAFSAVDISVLSLLVVSVHDTDVIISLLAFASDADVSNSLAVSYDNTDFSTVDIVSDVGDIGNLGILSSGVLDFLSTALVIWGAFTAAQISSLQGNNVFTSSLVALE